MRTTTLIIGSSRTISAQRLGSLILAGVIVLAATMGAVLAFTPRAHAAAIIDAEVSSLISTSAMGGYQDGPIATAKFTYITGIIVAPDGTMYIGDSNRIRAISPDRTTVSTIAGDGTSDYQDGPAATSKLIAAYGLSIGADGTIYFADSMNNRIRAISPDRSTVSTIAGSGTSGYQDGSAATARFSSPNSTAVATDGTIYVADTGNNRIRAISPDRTTVSTIAGDGTTGYQDGPAITAKLNLVWSIVIANDGTIYFADPFNNRIRAISPDRTTVSTVAGDSVGGYQDGPAATAKFANPFMLAIAPDGLIYVTDAFNNRIRAISPDRSTVSTIAGSGTSGNQDGSATTARFLNPFLIAVAPDGKIYIGDQSTSGASTAIRTVTPIYEPEPPVDPEVITPGAPNTGIAPSGDAGLLAAVLGTGVAFLMTMIIIRKAHRDL